MNTPSKLATAFALGTALSGCPTPDDESGGIPDAHRLDTGSDADLGMDLGMDLGRDAVDTDVSDLGADISDAAMDALNDPDLILLDVDGDPVLEIDVTDSSDVSDADATDGSDVSDSNDADAGDSEVCEVIGTTATITADRQLVGDVSANGEIVGNFEFHSTPVDLPLEPGNVYRFELFAGGRTGPRLDGELNPGIDVYVNAISNCIVEITDDGFRIIVSAGADVTPAIFEVTVLDECTPDAGTDGI